MKTCKKLIQATPNMQFCHVISILISFQIIVLLEGSCCAENSEGK